MHTPTNNLPSRPAKSHAYKQSHRIPPQRCALWVPELRGYVQQFAPKSVRVSDVAELAQHYDEDEAASMALAFREVTGMRVVVRPVYERSV